MVLQKKQVVECCWSFKCKVGGNESSRWIGREELHSVDGGAHWGGYGGAAGWRTGLSRQHWNQGKTSVVVNCQERMKTWTRPRHCREGEKEKQISDPDNFVAIGQWLLVNASFFLLFSFHSFSNPLPPHTPFCLLSLSYILLSVFPLLNLVQRLRF